MRNCKQKNCIFLQMGRGCKKCGDCSASPFLIADDCLRCYECENVPNSCRWDDESKANNQSEKEIEIEVKAQ